MFGGELESEGIPRGRGAVGSAVVSTLEGALLGTAIGSVADGLDPFVTVIAILVAVSFVEPTPVSIDNDLAVNVRAATTSGASLPSQLGMGFGLLSADLLGRGGGQKRKYSIALHDGEY